MAAHYSQPGEFNAVSLMAAAQFGTIALLFPWLLANGATAFGTLGSAWLMSFSATALAAWTLADVATVGGLLSMWIVALTTTRAVMTQRGQALGSALCTLYFVGGPLVTYFGMEFATSALHSHPELTGGPLLMAITTPHHLTPLAWVEPTLLIAIAGGLGFWRKIPPRSGPFRSTPST